ncbi:hypothetical protein I4F81_008142 [Pyropia yezoensis]|uniref:Uncharacterized protein n=1 Tax=Pyropia yezoensis TaxID=2788 RepID=A0ACC3C6B4_PYRYE|nr:hypothetical protein I4F81_008142 [Neopyropia yezoensis]
MYVAGRSLGECDPEDIMLHAAELMGMSLRLRFNELTRLHTDHLGRSERFPKFSIDEPTMANLAQSSYDLMPRPTTLRLDPRLNPVLAFACWMRLRGGASGFIFPAFKVTSGKMQVYPTQPAGTSVFTALLRRLHGPCGVLDAGELATHTAKRSGCQLYKALGQADVWLMIEGGWTNPSSFMRYTALCNRKEQRFSYHRPGSW